ncbi:MAG TPA: hypothetical protein IAC11_00345 [Candidatus Limiplasma pullicola]|nr:hypothetical protein [Candidatus Limiplasma pullicola]
MLAKRRAYLFAEAACLATALLWALSAFHCTHPLYEGVGADSAIFLCMGRGIAEGLTPYIDIIENKGPLFFLMLALPQMLVEGTTGVYVLEVLFLLGNCVLIMLMTRWLTGGRGNILCVAAGLTLLLKTCGQHCYCEEFDYFFMLLGFAVMVHTFTGQRRGEGMRAFALGLATAAVALIKVSDGIGLCVVTLVYFGQVLRTRRGFWREAARYAAGAAVVTVPVLMYLCAVGALGAMIQEYVINNFVHVGSAKDAGFWEIRRWLIVNDVYGWLSLQPVLLMLGALLVRLLTCWKDPERMKREKPLWLGMMLAAVGNMLCAFVSPLGFRQHLLMGYCTMLAACVLGVSAALEWLSSKAAWLRWPQAAAAACLLAAIIVPEAQELAPQRLEAVRQAAEEEHVLQCELSPYLEGYETVYSIGVGANWYWHMGLQPSYPYYNIVGFAADNVGAEQEVAFEQFLTQGTIEALVTGGDIEDYRSDLTNGIIDYVQNNYQVIVEDSYGRWLWTLI